MTELSRVTDSHKLLVQLNVELLAGPMRQRVPPVSVAATVPVSISCAVCVSPPASVSLSLVVLSVMV